MMLSLADKKKFFSNDPSGKKKKYLYLRLNEPEILKDIQLYSKRYSLSWLPWKEQVYLYAKNLKEPQVGDNGLYKNFWSFNKGYSNSGLLTRAQVSSKVAKLSNIECDLNKQYRGGAFSQKILESPLAVEQLRSRFWSMVKDQNIPEKQKYRCMVFMLVNNLKSIPKCFACGNESIFNASRGIFRSACSETCKYVTVNKKGFKTKDYILPSGKVVSIQGYEDKVLDYLLANFDESLVIVDDLEIKQYLGKLQYKHSGRVRRYFPDMLLLPNTVIEVKSSYTLLYDFSVNLAKRSACLNKGLQFEWHVVDQNIILDSNGMEWDRENYYRS